MMAEWTQDEPVTSRVQCVTTAQPHHTTEHTEIQRKLRTAEQHTSGDCLESIPPRMECKAPMLYRMHDISNFMSVTANGRRVNGSSLSVTASQ